ILVRKTQLEKAFKLENSANHRAIQGYAAAVATSHRSSAQLCRDLHRALVARNRAKWRPMEIDSANSNASDPDNPRFFH
ncbi:hypothetical protein SDJN02_15844, partial [Cucurbita argyrosperma subsp. argyrosperma]